MIEPRDTVEAATAVTRVLEDRFGLNPSELTRLSIGQATMNYKAVCAGRVVFVKRYLPEADLSAERGAIGLSELARSQGIPAARVLCSAAGDIIDATMSTPVSVWQWVPGAVRTRGFTGAELARIGAVLGHIHRLFATLPASQPPDDRPVRVTRSSLPPSA